LIKRLYILFFILAISSVSFAVGEDGDSSLSSSITFSHLEATLAKKIIHFKWEVEKENKGDYFLIEKSLDGATWKKVTKVKSLEDHKERHTYAISEINFAESAEEYFRIVRVDKYNKQEILDVVEINQPILTNMLLLSVKGKANKSMILSYDSLICSEGKITVMDENGTVVIQKIVHLSEGYNRLVLNIKNLNGGKYLVVVKDEFENKVSKALTVYRRR